MWLGTPTLTPEEAEAIERQHDQDVLQVYPVHTVYPTAADREAAARSGERSR